MSTTAALALRVILPAALVSVVCLLRFGAQVSPRAEVELGRRLKLGRHVRIGSYTKIKAREGELVLGDGVQVATGCFLDSRRGGLEIGSGSLIGPNCVILSSTYRFSERGLPLPQQGYQSKGVRIGRNVMIGANSTVLDGSDVGDDVIVGPGSVVTGRLPAGTVASGNPARVLFTRR